MLANEIPGGSLNAPKVHRISDNLSLIDLMPAIDGFEEFLGTYVLRSDKVSLVDVGPSTCAQNLLEGLALLSVNPEEVDYIFISHIHIDHAGGLGTLMKHMPRAKAIVHEKGIDHMIDPTRLWEGSQQALGELAEKYGVIEPAPQERIIVARDGMAFDLGQGTTIEVLLTPGHAPHHLSFLERKENRLFLGELGGVYTKGLIRPGTPPPFNLDQQLASMGRAIRIDPSAICYGHFGCVTGGTEELCFHKEQLILWGEIIAEGFLVGSSVDEIRERIAEKDRMLRNIKGLPRWQSQRENFFISNSIVGFIKYFEKHGGK